MANVVGGVYVFNDWWFGGIHLENDTCDVFDIQFCLFDGLDCDGADKKNKNVEEILKVWEENEEKWIMIGYHQEINDIEDLLIECYCYYLQGDEEAFKVSYKKLARNIEDLRNREKITFINVYDFVNIFNVM